MNEKTDYTILTGDQGNLNKFKLSRKRLGDFSVDLLCAKKIYPILEGIRRLLKKGQVVQKIRQFSWGFLCAKNHTILGWDPWKEGLTFDDFAGGSLYTKIDLSFLAGDQGSFNKVKLSKKRIRRFFCRFLVCTKKLHDSSGCSRTPKKRSDNPKNQTVFLGLLVCQ